MADGKGRVKRGRGFLGGLAFGRSARDRGTLPRQIHTDQTKMGAKMPPREPGREEYERRIVAWLGWKFLGPPLSA